MNSARSRLAALASTYFPRFSFDRIAVPLERKARVLSAAAAGSRSAARGFAVSIPKGDIPADLTEIVPDLGHHWKQLEKSPAEKHASSPKHQKELLLPPSPPPTLLAFDDLREEVLKRVFDKDQHLGKPYYFPTLTSILGGFRQGELTIFTGRTGVGKTTYLSQLSLDLSVNQGVNTLWGSFEIPNVRLVSTMLLQRAGFAMTSTKDMTEEQRLTLESEFDKKFKLMPRNMWFLSYYGAIDCDTVIAQIKDAIGKHGIQHVILDNLQFMTSLNGKYSDIYAKQDYICHRLRMLATEANIHVSLVIHPRKVDLSTRNGQPADLHIESVGGSPKSTQEADNIIMIQRDKESHQRVIDVQKNRFSGTLGRVTLCFDKNRMMYQEVGSSQADMFKGTDDALADAQGRAGEGDVAQQPVDQDAALREAFKTLLSTGNVSITLGTMKQFVEQNYGQSEQDEFEVWCQTLKGKGSETTVEVSETMFMEFFMHQQGSMSGGKVQSSQPASALDSDNAASPQSESGKKSTKKK